MKMNVKRMRINKKRSKNVKRFHHQIRNKQLMEAVSDEMSMYEDGAMEIEEDELSDIGSLNTHTTNNSLSNSVL